MTKIKNIDERQKTKYKWQKAEDKRNDDKVGPERLTELKVTQQLTKLIKTSSDKLSIDILARFEKVFKT